MKILIISLMTPNDKKVLMCDPLSCPGDNLSCPVWGTPLPPCSNWNRTLDRTSDRTEGYPQKGPGTMQKLVYRLEMSQRLGYPLVLWTDKLKILPSLVLRTRTVNISLFAIASFVFIHKFA